MAEWLYGCLIAGIFGLCRNIENLAAFSLLD